MQRSFWLTISVRLPLSYFVFEDIGVLLLDYRQPVSKDHDLRRGKKITYL